MPGGPGIRVDTHCRSGSVVPPQYDSLMAKLCVWAKDRPSAVKRMARALDETVVTGVPTTIPLLAEIMTEPQFLSGRYSTTYLTEHADLRSLSR